MRHIIEIDYKNGVIKWNGEIWDKMSCEDGKEDFWNAVDELVSEIRACEHFEEADAEREESDRMDKIRLFAESRKKIAEKELDKLGYFDENWDRINDLVGGDIMLAYRLGIYESMYNLMNALLKVLDEEEKRGDEE